MYKSQREIQNWKSPEASNSEIEAEELIGESIERQMMQRKRWATYINCKEADTFGYKAGERASVCTEETIVIIEEDIEKCPPFL